MLCMSRSAPIRWATTLFKRGSSVNGGMKTCHCSKGGSDRARSWSARIGTTWSAPFLVAGLKSRRHGILGIHTRAQLSAKTCKISLEASDQSFDEVDCIANHRSPDHDPLAGTIAAVTASPEVVFVNDALRVCKEMALLEGSGQSVQLVFREMVSVALASCSLPELAAFGEVLEGVPSCCGGSVNGGAKLVHPGGAKLVHLTLCGTRCWGLVPVVHRRDPRCFV